jgi:hypothetical protein
MLVQSSSGVTEGRGESTGRVRKKRGATYTRPLREARPRAHKNGPWPSLPFGSAVKEPPLVISRARRLRLAVFSEAVT